MAKFLDVNHQPQEVQLSPDMYREAADAGVSVEAHINAKYATAHDLPPAFTQIVANMGIKLQGNVKTGERASRLADVLNGTGTIQTTNTSLGGGAPESRIIFPATILAAVENKLQRDLTTAANAFDSFVAINETIAGNTYVQVVTDFSDVETNRPGKTAQLARPQNMLLLTAAERMGVVPTISQGVEWSDELEKGTTIDFLALSVARTFSLQRDREAQSSTLALLNGDIDVGQGPIPSQFRFKAKDFDPSITTAGKITQLAWVMWLYNMGDIRTINAIITDIETAFAIENREGKPVIVGDDPNSPRIDSQMRIANPLIPAEVSVFVTRNPDWPAGTVLGFDKRYGIRRITSLSANYQATDRDSIRKANAMRWDTGSATMRWWDEAFSVLELTV